MQLKNVKNKNAIFSYDISYKNQPVNVMFIFKKRINYYFFAFYI